MVSAFSVEQAKGSGESRSGSKLLLHDLLTKQRERPFLSILDASEKRLAAAVMGSESTEGPTSDRDGAEVSSSCSREVSSVPHGPLGNEC